MNEQHSQTSENRSSIKKAESSRDGFETTPAAAEVDGATGGNEPTGRTAVEVMDFYTAEEMHEHAEETENTDDVSAATESDVFNPVLDSVSEVSEK